MIKGIIFDYDGVIAESVHVKTEAFAELYKECGPETVEKIISHHEANGGISRFQKIKLYHKKYLNEDLNNQGIEQLAQKFSKLVLDKVIESPYILGAYDFLSNNYKKYELFISTGTPTGEIEVILKRKNIRKFFKEVYGSPESKTYHVKNIIENFGFQQNELVFIGDAITDRDAARNTGIHFIGRFTTSEEIKSEKLLIEDFRDLREIIQIL